MFNNAQWFQWNFPGRYRLHSDSSTWVCRSCKTAKLYQMRGSPATIVCFTNFNSPSFRVSASGSSRNKFIDSSCSLTSCCDICDCNNFAKAIGKFCWSRYILCGIFGFSWDYDFRRLNSSITSNTCKHKTGSKDHILHKPIIKCFLLRATPLPPFPDQAHTAQEFEPATAPQGKTVPNWFLHILAYSCNWAPKTN